MKKISLSALLIVMLSIVSCDDSTIEESSLDIQISEADLSSEESANTTYEEIDDMVEQSLLSIPSTGRTINKLNESLRCAEVNHDEENKTIEVIFDGTCEDQGGHIKNGKIIINYSDRKYVPGAFRKVTLVDFYYDSIQVEGVRTITNVSETTEDAPKFNIVLEGGKLSFPDGTFISRTSNHTRTWLRAANPTEDQVSLTGNSSGVKRDGVAYESEITTELVFKRICRNNRTVGIPVSGTKEISWDNNLLMVDFGEGDCDNLATFTLNGTSVEKEINPRGKKK